MASFLSGLLIGVMLGLALSPIVRAWMLGKMADGAGRSSSDERRLRGVDRWAEPTHREEPRAG